MSETKVGEVLEASTASFLAQSYELHAAPPLGSLVRVEEADISIYAVVQDANTASIDPGRPPIARGKDAAEEIDIYRENPQLEKLFRTNFDALVVGHKANGFMHHYLPPRPARVHSFVYGCTPEEVQDFTSSLDFLHLLVNGAGNTDELIAACLRRAAEDHVDGYDFKLGAGRELVRVLGGDPHRLGAILRRIR